MDACPGRLNQVSLYITKLGVFYGQCSELCGINHAFMPIVVQSVTAPEYEAYLTGEALPAVTRLSMSDVEARGFAKG